MIEIYKKFKEKIGTNIFERFDKTSKEEHDQKMDLLRNAGLKFDE